MTTYPQYPQPVLAQSNGRKWYLEVTIPGILRINGPITDGHPLSNREATLINTTRTMAYRLSLSDDSDPLLLANSLPAEFGNREAISVWAPNGREWEIYIDNEEVAFVRSVGSDWARAQSPVLKDADNIPWRITIANSGVYSVSSDPNERTLHSLILRSRDDTAYYQVTVSTLGVLTLSSASDPVATFYEAELSSPDGNKWAIYIDHVDGVPRIYVSDVIETAENERDVWPLLMGKDLKTLYVLDSRFKLPRGVRGGR